MKILNPVFRSTAPQTPSSTVLARSATRSFEQQQYRASGLTLATAAIALWNTVYLERATNALCENGHSVDPALRKHLSPLGWEHINLTGDYQWRNTARLGKR